MENIKEEEYYIYDKNMNCHVCNRSFSTKMVRTGRARFQGTDDILKPLYLGVDTCKYDIILCPHCGYAASQRNYGHLTPKMRQVIRDDIEPKFKISWKDDTTYSYDVAIRRCKMAILTEMMTHGKISERAYLCLKLAWLYRGEIHEMETNGTQEKLLNQYKEHEMEYIEDAYKGFKEAIAKEYPPICGMDEHTVHYLLATLAVKCGENEEARQFASRIITGKGVSSQLKEKTRLLMEQIRK